MNIVYSILLTVCTGGMGLLGIYSAVYALANRRYAGRFLRWLLYSVPVVIGASVLGSWFAHFNQDTGLSLLLLVLPIAWLVLVLGAQNLLARPPQDDDEMVVILTPADRED